MLLFKLELSIGGPNLGCFWVKLTPWKFLQALRPPKRHLLAWDRVVWRTDRKKTNGKFICYYVDRLWAGRPLWSADDEFLPSRSSPERNELCWVWFWSVKRFRTCGRSILPIVIHWPTCPCSFASTTVQQLIQYHLLHDSASNVVRTGLSVNGNSSKWTPTDPKPLNRWKPNST